MLNNDFGRSHFELELFRIVEKQVGGLFSWKSAPRSGNVDGILTIRFPGRDLELPAELKRQCLLRDFTSIRNQLKAIGKGILIAEWIDPKLMRAMRDDNLFYMDGAGNVFLSADGIHIYVERPSIRPQSVPDQTGLSETGLKVLFLLLADPESINWNFRRLGAMAGVSLGSVKGFFDWMRAQGFLIINGKRRLLRRKAALFDRWVNGYQDILAKSTRIGRYRFAGSTQTRWESLPLNPENSIWGGEAGAFKLAQGLMPTEFHIFTSLDELEFMKEFRLVPDTNGKVIVFDRFWGEGFGTLGSAAHPLLLYPELLREPDARRVEQAELIHSKFIATKFK